MCVARYSWRNNGHAPHAMFDFLLSSIQVWYTNLLFCQGLIHRFEHTKETLAIRAGILRAHAVDIVQVFCGYAGEFEGYEAYLSICFLGKEFQQFSPFCFLGLSIEHKSLFSEKVRCALVVHVFIIALTSQACS